MRPIRLRAGPGVVFAACFVLALVAFLPMRLALGWFGVGEEGLTARRASGTIWSGALTEARFGAIALGDVRAGVAAFPLLLGRARIDLAGRRVDATGRRLSGAITVSRHAIGLEDVTATLPVGAVFAPVPVTALDLDDVTVRFAGDICERAEGRVRAQLTGDVAGQAIPATMAGTPRCDAGAILLPLRSPAGEESSVRVWADGRYRAELTLAPGDAAATARLQAAGFVATPRGLQLSIEGRF